MRTLPTFIALLFVIPCLALGAIDSARVKEIAGMLPKRPAGFGEPIANRAAWEKLAAVPDYQAAVKEARATAAKALPRSPDELYLDYSKTGNRERWQSVARQRRGRVSAFTMAECLENRGAFLKPLEETIRAICAERTWVMPAHDGGLNNFNGRTMEMDLGATMLGWDLAMADYLVGEKLSPETRQLLRENLQRRIFRPFRDMVEGRQRAIHWLGATHNWNAVCLAGVTGAALATVEPAEERAFFVAAAEQYTKNFLRGFTADGYCSEGLGYWNYGFGYYVMLAEAVRQATGSKLDLLADPAARGPAFFGVRSEILNGIYPPIADCAPGTKPEQALLQYLCRRFDMGGAACEGKVSPTARGSLYHAVMYSFLPKQLPVVKSSVTQKEDPRRTWFEDGGVLICRPGSKGGEFAVALKGGHNAEHHNHNDVGTFMVVAGKSMVLCDPGSEIYTARTFSGRRYDSDVLNSFGHPVPRVAGQLQRPGIQAKGKVVKTEFTEARDTVVLDLSSAYGVPSLKRLERTFVYERQPSPALTVTDRVEFESPQSFETALVTWGEWKQAGRELVVSDEGSSVRVQIDTGGVEFKVTSKRLEADVPKGRHAQRLGVALSAPVKEATVKMVIKPGDMK